MTDEVNKATKVIRDIYLGGYTQKEKKYSHEEMILNEPYTIFGSPTINTEIGFSLKVGGLKKIIRDFKLNGDDSLFITTSTNPNNCGISFIRKENRTNEKKLGDIIKYK